MNKKLRDLTSPTMVGDLDDLAAQIISAVSRETARIEGKVDVIDQKVTVLEQTVDKMSFELSDVHRRVIDLEVDTVPRKDFQDLKFLVATHRHP